MPYFPDVQTEAQKSLVTANKWQVKIQTQVPVKREGGEACEKSEARGVFHRNNAFGRF